MLAMQVNGSHGNASKQLDEADSVHCVLLSNVGNPCTDRLPVNCRNSCDMRQL